MENLLEGQEPLVGRLEGLTWVWMGGVGLSEGHKVGGIIRLLVGSHEVIDSLPRAPPGAVSIVTCTKHTYRCHNGLCVNKKDPKCDGKKDCIDGSDEKDCGE